MRPHDVLTHCSTGTSMQVLDGAGRVLESIRRAWDSGVVMDVALFRLERGRFPLYDAALERREAGERLRCTATLVAGRPLPVSLPGEPAPWIEPTDAQREWRAAARAAAAAPPDERLTRPEDFLPPPPPPEAG